MNANETYPSITRAVGLLIILIILQVFLSIVALIAQLIADLTLPPGDPSLLGVINILAFAVVLLWARRKRRETNREFYQLFPFRLSILAPLLLVAIGMSIIASEADNVLRFFLPIPEFLARIFGNLSTGGVLSFIAIGIIAPHYRGVSVQGCAPEGIPNAVRCNEGCIGLRDSVCRVPSESISALFRICPGHFPRIRIRENTLALAVHPRPFSL